MIRWTMTFRAAECLDQLPPVEVYHDGKIYWMADGFHRLLACRRAGRVTIQATVIQGGMRDAILHACGANALHGLRRSTSDKRKAVDTLLRDDEWKLKSDRWISFACQVDHKTVAAARLSLGNSPVTIPSGDAETPLSQESTSNSDPATTLPSATRKFVNKHGSESTMRTAAIAAAVVEGGAESLWAEVRFRRAGTRRIDRQ